MTPKEKYRVEYGTENGQRLLRKTFSTLDAADRFAARWSDMDSRGGYWALVTDTDTGEIVAKYYVR